MRALERWMKDGADPVSRICVGLGVFVNQAPRTKLVRCEPLHSQIEPVDCRTRRNTWRSLLMRSAAWDVPRGSAGMVGIPSLSCAIVGHCQCVFLKGRLTGPVEQLNETHKMFSHMSSQNSVMTVDPL